MTAHSCFDEKTFPLICKRLARRDKDLAAVIQTHGIPPMWKRPPGFATLIHIILEQQVSLASAKAAMNKLVERTGSVTPKKILALSDEAMKACYFSRQKTIYARHLAAAVINKELIVNKLSSLPDEEIRTALKKIKGIGDWTVDVYLMMALQRSDLFPSGDIALVKSMKEVKNLHHSTDHTRLLNIAAEWKPYRTVAAFILWHSYLSKRNRQY